jgi:hypothetical protein
MKRVDVNWCSSLGIYSSITLGFIPILLSATKMSDSASDLESLRQETKSTVDPVKSFLSGGFGGIACVLVGHPFDLTYVSLGISLGISTVREGS